MEPLLGLLGQLVLAPREAHEVGPVERDPARVGGQREVERGDVAEAADDARVADRAPVDPVVQARGPVAAAERVDHVDPGLRQRPLEVGGALLVGAGQVAVHLAVVGAEHDPVPERLEVGRRLLDLGARLGRAGRRDDGDGRPLGQRRGLHARRHPATALPLSIASAISSPEACSEPSTSSTWSSATSSSLSGPAGSNQSATPGALEQDRVGRDGHVRGAQRAVADPVADHAGEHRLVVVALGDQRAARRVGQRADLAVGDERGLAVQAVEDRRARARPPPASAPARCCWSTALTTRSVSRSMKSS